LGDITIPDYGYKCEECGNFRDFNTISGREKTQCPKCGKECSRDVEYELNSGVSFKLVTDNPRWSISMGVPPSQVEEFRKRFPKSTYDDRGRLLIKNRNHKLSEMKARGFVELDRRHYGK
jgi:putative FmdB family regulatory protein